MSKWRQINKPWREHNVTSGTVIRVIEPDNGQTTEVLVGEISDLGGTCDCCRWFGHNTVILAELDLNEMIEAAKKDS